MHPLTKIGLALILLTYVTASTLMSMHAVAAAHRQGVQRVHEVTMPCVFRAARLPTDV